MNLCNKEILNFYGNHISYSCSLFTESEKKSKHFGPMPTLRAASPTQLTFFNIFCSRPCTVKLNQQRFDLYCFGKKLFSNKSMFWQNKETKMKFLLQYYVKLGRKISKKNRGKRLLHKYR